MYYVRKKPSFRPTLKDQQNLQIGRQLTAAQSSSLAMDLAEIQQGHLEATYLPCPPCLPYPALLHGDLDRLPSLTRLRRLAEAAEAPLKPSPKFTKGAEYGMRLVDRAGYLVLTDATGCKTTRFKQIRCMRRPKQVLSPSPSVRSQLQRPIFWALLQEQETAGRHQQGLNQGARHGRKPQSRSPFQCSTTGSPAHRIRRTVSEKKAKSEKRRLPRACFRFPSPPAWPISSSP